MEGGFPGAHSDWTVILQMLKSADEMEVYQGAFELRDVLSYSQDSQMSGSGFMTEQYMDILVKIVSRDPVSDLSNEVKFFAIQSLTTLMDIFPQLVNSLVNAGLVKGISNLLETSQGFIDLTEACIKALEKIVLENPPAVLKSGAVSCILQQMDFFEVSTQQRIFRIIQKISRHSSSEADFDSFILPLLPFICLNLSIENSNSDQKKIEDASKIIFELQESCCIFYSPINDFQKIGVQFDKILDFGVFDIILEQIRQTSERVNRIQNLKMKEFLGINQNQNNFNQEIENDEEQINSINQNHVLSQQTIINFFKILENASKYSNKVCNKLFGESTLLRDLSPFLPHDYSGKVKQYNSDDYPFIMDVINLLNSVISDKDISSENYDEEKKDNENSANNKKFGAKKDFEKAKREFQLSPQNKEKIIGISENLLPRIFFVYESTINPQFRIKTLQVIEKIISIFDDELLKNFIQPKQFANFIYQIIKTKHSSSLNACLKITKKVLDCSPFTYALSLIREGVSHMVRSISTEDKLKEFLGISKEVNIADKSFDLDIYEVKEALHYTRINNPDDHIMRDYYERRLLELVELQKHSHSLQPQIEQLATVGGGLSQYTKSSKPASKNAQLKENYKDSPLLIIQPKKNLALLIINQAQAILSQYFDNNEFIHQLEAGSTQVKQQLGIKADLSQISAELCTEAGLTKCTMEEMHNIRRLLTRVADLLTLDDSSITSYEFRQSKLLFALEMLLTKTPSQARVAIEQRKAEETGEEMKRSEEIDLMEAQQQSKQISKKESRCMMSRLKLFAHILLIKKGNRISPLQALIELNHKVISEDDSFLLSGFGVPQDARAIGYSTYQSGVSSMFSHPQGASFGDYDHCISALRQLQKRVTVNLVYDPKKSFLKTSPHSLGQTIKEVKREFQEEGSEWQDCEGDSHMEDMTPSARPEEIPVSDIQKGKLEGAEENVLVAQAALKRGQSHLPALQNLAGSPNKHPDGTALMKSTLDASKVFLKRHQLYNELKQIPVTVEQSSCLQVLEDFLRNQIKTMENVKGLKFDYGFGGFGGGGLPGSSSGSPFDGAFGGHFQSITQQILRKNLGNGAKKLLDAANDRLAKILNAGAAYKIKPARLKKKKPKQVEQAFDEEMEGHNGESAHSDENKTGERDEESLEEDPDDDEDSNSHDSNQYGDIEEDEDDEQEAVAAEIEKQRLLDLYVEELSDEVAASALPEDQQHMLVKILTRQHGFMMDQLKINYEDAARASGLEGEQDYDREQLAQEEDIYRMEERLEDFRETMERVQARYFDKKAVMRDKKKAAKPNLEEKKKENLDQNLSNDSDQEMSHPNNEADELLKKFQDQEEGDFLGTELAFLEDQRLHQLSEKFKAEPVPHLKQSTNTKDVEMQKPIDASVLDSIEEKLPAQIASEQMKEKTGQEQINPGTFDEEFLKLKRLAEGSRKNIDHPFNKDFGEQERKIQKISEREMELRQKIRDVRNQIHERAIGEENLSQQTQQILTQDLEELLKQSGEDIDFEFYFEGKQIMPNQTIFEIIKKAVQKRAQAERAAQQAEFPARIQEEIRKKVKKLAETQNDKSQAERTQLKRESDRLKDLFTQLSSQYTGAAGGMKGGPPAGFLSSLNAYKISFCIKDKNDEVGKLKRQRLDSLAELTSSSALKRARSISQAVQDVSGSCLKEFVQQILQQEFKVFDESSEEELAHENKTKTCQFNDQLICENEIIKSQKLGTSKTFSQQEDRKQLGRSLKLLKVVNFLYTNQDLFTRKGVKLVMMSNQELNEDGPLFITTKDGTSPGKQDPGSQSADFDEPGFSDIDLKAGFAEIQSSAFNHQKLDSYLQKGIKDPYNLVQGTVQGNLQQIVQNCPFLFPFSTKQLYFKLMTFRSAIDVHRSMFYLKQHLKYQSGGQKANSHDKDNLKKIAQQKVAVRRDQLILSAFTLIQKIDKKSFLEVEFQGEEGVGLGPTLEFYDNIAEEFKKWSVKIDDNLQSPMWRQTADNLLFPSAVCIKSFSQETIKQIYEIFRLCGTIVAKAIVDDRQIDLPISPLFWKLCMGSQLRIFDMQKLDEGIFSTLSEFQIVANKAEEIKKNSMTKKLSADLRNRQLQSLRTSSGCSVEDYALDFTLPCYSHIDLVANGKDKDVTMENAQDYVDLVLHYSFHETVKIQVQAFKKGFNSIFPITSLAVFTHSSCDEIELETMVCGIKCSDSEWQNKEELIKYIRPDHGYHRKSAQYLNFIRYINELDSKNRPNFMKFLTGSKRLPIGGFKCLQPNLTFVLKKENVGQNPDAILPSVMACQNYVKSPLYSNYEVLKNKFDYAVSEGQQNFSLS